MHPGGRGAHEQGPEHLAAGGSYPGEKGRGLPHPRGAMTGERIAEWMRGDLFPLLRGVFPDKPVVTVMDNAQCRGVAVQTCIGERLQAPQGGALQPRTNPIEGVFSQVKSFVSRRTPVNGEELVTQIREGVASVTEENTWNYLKARWGVMKLILRGFQLGSDHVFAFVEE